MLETMARANDSCCDLCGFPRSSCGGMLGDLTGDVNSSLSAAGFIIDTAAEQVIASR